MANLNAELRTIQLATRGEQVRDAIVDALRKIDEQSDVTVDAALSGSSGNPVENRAVYAALQGKQGVLSFDAQPTSGSSNCVTSGAVYTALQRKQGGIQLSTVSLSTDWEGSDPYRQVVSIPGTTPHSKIDLQPDADLLAQLVSDGVTALWIENDAGTLRACALGAAPSSGLEVQCTITEVIT